MSAEERREQLVDLFEEVKACEKCPLHETRTKAVFGAGDANADLMFVGEAPGAEEDRQGLPFVGRAGQLLNQMLEEIGLSREDVFIANVLKSRPPGNRDPQPMEIEACRPYLFEQVRLIEPTVICTLGNFATKLLSGNPAGITKVRGAPQVHEIGGRTVFLLPLFHPAAALRTPAVKETLRSGLRDAARPARVGPPATAEEPEEEPGRGSRAGARALPRSARLLWLRRGHARPRRPKRSAPELAAQLGPGDVVVISGEVGAGKTTLIRGACRALGIEGPITSPTFTIGHRYEGGRLPVSHLDLYRLDGLEGEEPALLDDYLDPDAVAFVEWPAVAEPQLADRKITRGAPRPRRRRQPRGRASRRIQPQIGVFGRARCM